MHENTQAVAYLRGLLQANATIVSLGLQNSIWRGLAPPGSDCPYILIVFQGGQDRNTFGARGRLFTRPQFQVKAVTEGTDDELGATIATAIDNALVGQSDLVAADGLAKLGVYRDAMIDYPVFEGEIRYNHIGGLYRVFCHTP